MAPKRKPSDAPKPAKRTRAEPLEPIASNALPFFQGQLRPPPAVSLATGEPCHLSEQERAQWESNAGGQSAARRGPEYDVCRLVGSFRFGLTLGSDAGAAQWPKLLGLLNRPGRPRHADVKWGWNRGVAGRPALASPPLENWHTANGEVVGQGFASPAEVLQNLYSGSLVSDQPQAMDLLEGAPTPPRHPTRLRRPPSPPCTHSPSPHRRWRQPPPVEPRRDRHA